MNEIVDAFEFYKKDPLEDFVAYLAQGLNTRLPIDLIKKGMKVVNYYSTIEPNVLSNIETPALICNKMNSTYNMRGNYNFKSLLSLSYIVSYPTIEKLPKLLKFVEKNLYDLICEYEFNRFNNNSTITFPIRFEYRTTKGEIAQNTFSVLRTIINIQNI